jgi:hypothetical protein
MRQPSTRSSLQRPPIGAPARRKTISAWRGREGSCGAGAASEIPHEFTRALQLASAAAATSIMVAQRAKGIVPKSFWTFAESYARYNTERPLMTRVLTTAVLAGTADVFAQYITSGRWRRRSKGAEGEGAGERKPWYDPKRTLVMASWGLVGSGPFNHFWYMWLDRAVVLPRLAHSVGLKIVLDHVVYFPVLIGYFAWTDFFRGRAPTVSEALVGAAFSDKLMPVMRANVISWTAVHVLTFTIIPPQYHVLWVSVASLFWSGYCSSATES